MKPTENKVVYDRRLKQEALKRTQIQPNAFLAILKKIGLFIFKIVKLIFKIIAKFLRGIVVVLAGLFSFFLYML